MDCQCLTMKGFVDEVVQALDGYQTRKFCFVLGAGASRSSGIKSGQELVDLWDGELLERDPEGYKQWKQQQKITDENKYSFYSKYYEKRFERTPEDGYNFLEKMMSSAKPYIGYVILAYILNRKTHDTNVVITTNFDRLVEDAIHDYEHESPLVIGHESLAHYIRRPINRPTIIKIHRDLLLNPKNKMDETRALDGQWNSALDTIFSEYHPIFIGYAGNDDSLMEFLHDHRERYEDGTWRCPYWLRFKNEDLTDKVRVFLKESGGFLISHDGFDETLYLIGSALGYKLPSEETFLSDARQHFQHLKDSVDKMTQQSLDPQASLRSKKEATKVDTENDEKNMLAQAIDRVIEQSELQRLYKQAVTLSKEKKFTEAIEIEKELITQQPDNALYHYRYALTLQEMKRDEDALMEFQQAVRLAPENAEYQNELGNAFYLLGQYEKAIFHMQKATGLDPDEPYFLICLGDILIDTGSPDRSIPILRRAVELDPDEVYPHLALMRALCEMNRYSEALPEIDAAILLDSNDATLHFWRGEILSNIDRHEEAVKEYQKAVDLDPGDSTFHFELGQSLWLNGDFEGACAEIWQAIDSEPNNAKYYHELGTILREESKYPPNFELEPDELDAELVEAIEEADAAIESTLGTIDDYKDEDINEPPFDPELMAQAVEVLREAAKLKPENAIYQYDLGDILWDLGELKAAKIQVKKALALDPDNDQYQTTLNRIESEIVRKAKSGSPS